MYPPTQEVYETGDVVIQCRDEGAIRAHVYWEKAVSQGKDDSLVTSTLPQGAVHYNGRLEISRNLYLLMKSLKTALRVLARFVRSFCSFCPPSSR